jgi:hypothetical protein
VGFPKGSITRGDHQGGSRRRGPPGGVPEVCLQWLSPNGVSPRGSNKGGPLMGVHPVGSHKGILPIGVHQMGYPKRGPPSRFTLWGSEWGFPNGIPKLGYRRVVPQLGSPRLYHRGVPQVGSPKRCPQVGFPI